MLVLKYRTPEGEQKELEILQATSVYIDYYHLIVVEYEGASGEGKVVTDGQLSITPL